VIDSFFVTVDPYQGDLVLAEGGGIYQGEEPGKDLLAIIIPGGAEYEKLQVGSFFFKEGYFFCGGRIAGLVIMEPFESSVGLQHILADEAFQDLVGTNAGDFVFRLGPGEDTDADDDGYKEKMLHDTNLAA
jgi:hypothetical protein